MPIKLLIVDDHKMIRDSIRFYLENDDKYEVIGEASNGNEALDMIKNHKIDLVIMDINMDEKDGITCTQELMEINPDAKVLALTMLNESLHIKQMMNAGASGYLLKHSGEEEIKKAIDAIANGGTYFSNEVTATIMDNIAKRQARVPKKSKWTAEALLTSREKEVLHLIVKEYTNQEIADELYISPRTVDAHKRNLIEKTEVKNVAGLVMYAINRQIFEDV
ncbi:MAG: response regulator transcription factor [Bacteroidetes bacterium]|nr:response regulator transcription factor [Bacteroidota bacterium]